MPRTLDLEKHPEALGTTLIPALALAAVRFKPCGQQGAGRIGLQEDSSSYGLAPTLEFASFGPPNELARNLSLCAPGLT